MQIRTVLLSIQALLSAPNPDDFLDADVAEKWKADERGAKSMGLLYHERKSITRFFSFQLVIGLKNMPVKIRQTNYPSSPP